MTQPTLSFHLNKLEQAGIIVKKEGQSHYYTPNIHLLDEMVKFGQQALAVAKKSR
ncbi:MAG: helix-turn-helix transcriptional regulator [Mycoplasma sp.]|nr:helix-turn-helix transcriptional regulator [Candidatus Hennigella equi]